MTNQKLTARQTRWLEKLTEFNFRIIYHSGKKNARADALTRQKSGPLAEDDDRVQHRHQILLPPDRLQIVSLGLDPGPNLV